MSNTGALSGFPIFKGILIIYVMIEGISAPFPKAAAC